MISGVLYALLAGLMWGLIFVGPLLVPEYPAMLQSMGRYLALGLIALPLAWLGRARLRQLSRNDWWTALGLTMMGNLIYYACLSSAIQRTGAPVSTMIIGTLPVVLPVFANLLYSQRDGKLPWRRLFPALVCIAVGLICVNVAELRQGLPDFSPWRYGSGIALALGSVACWAWYALRNARWLRENPHQPPMMWATAQALVTLPVSLAGYLAACAWLHGQQAGFPLPFGPRPAVFITLMLAIADPLLRFAMLIYLCVPGMFIGVNVVGMFYLQRVTGMVPGAIGALMVPWSLASFAAITFTGRYFNRFGPRPLVMVGCLLQAAGILLLLKIDAHSPLALLILAFTLMGGGGSLCSSTAQSSAFLHTPAEEMPDASALWNLNRQLSFFAGSALLALLLRVFPPAYAWQGVFISAAAITLLPLLFCLRLNNRAIIHRLHTTLEKS